MWASQASGAMVLVALAVAMSAIFAQVTVNDLVIARYTPDAWRGRVYAVRYFLTFLVSGLAVSAAWRTSVRAKNRSRDAKPALPDSRKKRFDCGR